MGTETKLLVFDREDMGIEIREPLAQQFPRHWRGAFSTYRWITSMRHSTKTAYQFQYLCAFQRPRCRTLLHDARFSIEGRRPIDSFAPSYIAIIDAALNRRESIQMFTVFSHHSPRWWPLSRILS